MEAGIPLEARQGFRELQRSVSRNWSSATKIRSLR